MLPSGAHAGSCYNRGTITRAYVCNRRYRRRARRAARDLRGQQCAVAARVKREIMHALVVSRPTSVSATTSRAVMAAVREASGAMLGS